jgi:hypothetical protein
MNEFWIFVCPRVTISNPGHISIPLFYNKKIICGHQIILVLMLSKYLCIINLWLSKKGYTVHALLGNVRTITIFL